MSATTFKVAGVGGTGYEPAAVAAHGIGRGEYVSLVFSGALRVLGEIAGYPTWQTPRKFALQDPRIDADMDFARRSDMPLEMWTRGVKPTPGVCFVFTDERHPGVSEMRARGGVAFEDYLVLQDLTIDRLLGWRIERWLLGVRERPLVMLGYGDQGKRMGAALLAAGVEAGEVVVADGDAQRAASARDAGFDTIDLRDPGAAQMAVISTPLRRPEAFDAIVDSARRDGRSVFDNAAADGRDAGEFVIRESVRMTRGAMRAVRGFGDAIRLKDGALPMGVQIVRQEARVFGGVATEHLQSGQREMLESAGKSVELDSAWRGERLPGMSRKLVRAWVGVDGQSNQHDAALGLFACREFLMTVCGGAWARSTREVCPSETRVGLASGATAFEALLSASMTGRTLGAPYLTAPEQLTLGVLAREFAWDSPVVEIGSALGGSTLLMARATERRAGGVGAAVADGARVISVDCDANTRPAMRANVEHAGLSRRIVMIQKTSDDAVDEVAGMCSGGGAGLVFIDGLHTFAQCAKDVENYGSLVRPGGVMLLHDTDVRHSGVVRCALNVAMHNARFELLCIVDTISVFVRKS